jgi:mono/diheme cytochrome c family protein
MAARETPNSVTGPRLPIYSAGMFARLARLPGRSASRLGARARASLALAGAFAACLGFASCGSQGIQLAKSDPDYKGAVIFREHCSGCHSLAVVGAEGSATNVKNRVRTNGPNFNYRHEEVEQVLYAIHNGGFSGAIMPENIVVGEEAQEVAHFLSKYSGLKATKVPSIETSE